MLFAFLSYVLFHDETPHQYTSINGLHKSNTWFSGLYFLEGTTWAPGQVTTCGLE